MTRFIYIFVFCTLSIFGHSQKNATLAAYSANKSSKSETMRLKRDAARLALRMEAGSEALHYLPIQIADQKIDKIIGLLKAVKNSKLAAAKDINNCKIHVKPNPAIDQFTIIYDKNIDWATPLREGINETDNDQINELLEQYDLFISNHISWNSNFDAITIQSHRPYNIAALAQEFSSIDGVEKIDFSSKESDGNDIELALSGKEWFITYYLRWGSCMNGCDNLHSWSFKIDQKGNISFLEEKGNEIPAWMRCETESSGHFLAVKK